MNRRTFIRSTALGSLSFGTLAALAAKGKSHVLTLSFDDGFKKSFYRVAEIHEEYDLKACLNVIATGHKSSFKAEPIWIKPGSLGDFNDWNKLKARGHEVMLHTWEHLNLTEVPELLAKKNMDRCFDYFEKHLDGYDPKLSVYNFAYNASNADLDNHALERVRAVRTGGWLVLDGHNQSNALNDKESKLDLGCWGHGPGFCDDYVADAIEGFLKTDGGWLILNLHGLDEEGWGPIRTSSLDRVSSETELH